MKSDNTSQQHDQLPLYTHSPTASLINPLPDFSSFTNIKLKKERFFEYLLPLVESENNHILKLRSALFRLREKASHNSIQALSPKEKTWVNGLADLYNCEAKSSFAVLIEDLLIKVNTVPPSLVLAQAAIESGWGTSRFATQGNNLFGQWCFKKGCGLVPLNRSLNKSHEVATFQDINSSIRAYLKNINSFSAYAQFRKIRRDEHNRSGFVSNSLSLISGLSNYSEQGEAYLTKVRSVINVNNLTRFDIGA